MIPKTLLLFIFTILPCARSAADSLPCECHHSTSQEKSPLRIPQKDNDTIPTSPNQITRLDLIAFYNDQARTSLGGAPNDPTDATAIRQKILDSVAQANLAYQNSNLPVRLILLAIEPTNYPHPVDQNFSAVLDQLETDNDDQLDDLLARQRFYGADLVTLFLDSDVSGGKANVLTARTKPLAYSVVRAKNPDLTLAHEIGHNLGCRHRLSTYSNGRPIAWFDDSFATLFTGANGEKYATVMASTSTTNRENAERVPIFSSPALSWQGTTTGRDDSDNARAIRASAPVLSQIQQRRPLASAQILLTPGGNLISLNRALPNRTYQLQRSPDARTWTTLPNSTRTANPSGSNTTFIPDPQQAPTTYYRWLLQTNP